MCAYVCECIFMCKHVPTWALCIYPREGMWRLEVYARCPTPACPLHYFLRQVNLQLPACLDWFASEHLCSLGLHYP